MKSHLEHLLRVQELTLLSKSLELFGGVSTGPGKKSLAQRSHRRIAIAQRTFVLENVNGLHARPAELLVKRVAKFQSQVIVQCGGESTDARSLFGLLSLTSAAASGDEGSKVLPRKPEAHDSNSEYENDA